MQQLKTQGFLWECLLEVWYSWRLCLRLGVWRIERGGCWMSRKLWGFSMKRIDWICGFGFGSLGVWELVMIPSLQESCEA